MAMTGLLRRTALLALLTGMLSAAGAQEVFTYTENDDGPRRFALGYPVPEPVASLTPVDGFRDSDSLHARHQSLALEHDFVSGHRVGRTFKGADIFAYTVSDPDSRTADGHPEPAFQITGTVHAREWQSPEVVTGIIERLVERRRDGWLYEYLVDNTNLVVIPVLNIDGLRQTQKYPSRVIVGQDPTASRWPRDGRMRRKNMRGADRDLLTLGDHLNGVDLNRNSPPFAPSSLASANPDNLIFHGNGSVTEPETRALQAATELAPSDRLRLYTDFHSFAASFFDRLSGNSRRDAIHTSLINRAVRTLRATGTTYSRDPSGPGQGIGSTDEYFADVVEVPSWTLELEPQGRLGGRQYNGFGTEHDGFILPDAEVDRVRRHIANAYALLFYAQAGPPSIAEVRVLDGSDNLVWAGEWRRSGPKRRRFVTTTNGTLVAGRDYQLWVAFDKPMRFRDEAGAVVNYPGINVLLAPVMELTGAGEPLEVAARQGRWLDRKDSAGAPGYRRYRDDAFIAPLAVPASLEPGEETHLTLEVALQDLAGNTLDADPSTVVGWAGGHWVSYESTDGTAGDSGGRDTTIRVPVAKQEPAVVSLALDRARVVEGGRVSVSLERNGVDTDFTVGLRAERESDSPQPEVRELFEISLGFQAGGESTRTVSFTVPDDLAVRPPEAADEVRVTAFIEDGAARMASPATLTLPVEDNDSPGRRVASILNPYEVPFGLEVSPLPPAVNAGRRLADTLREAQSAAAPVQINLADEGGYSLLEAQDGGNTGFPAITGNVTITGRDTLIARETGNQTETPPFRLFHVTPGARLRLEGIRLEQGRLDGGALGGAVLNDGRFEADRSVFRDNAAVRGGALANAGTAEILRSAFLDNRAGTSGGAVFNDGHLVLGGATVSGNTTDGRGGGLHNLSGLTITGSTLTGNAGAPGADLRSVGQALVGNSIFASDGACVEERGGTITSSGFNLDVDGTCRLTGEGDRASAATAVMAREGAVHRPVPEGPAVDTGDPGGCGSPDVLGAPRPFGFNLGPGETAACDVGAVEHALAVHRGMWFNPERSGHGIDVQQARDQLVVTWFTYGPDGDPVWYQATGPFDRPDWEADLYRFQFDHDENGAAGEVVGTMTLEFHSAASATFGWDLSALGQGTGSEPFEPLIADDAAPIFDVTGHWAAADESNWGLTVDAQGGLQIATVYYYDNEGNPRWVQGTGIAGQESAIELDSFTGFCPGCDMQAPPVRTMPAGQLHLRYFTRRTGGIETDFGYPGVEGGQWQRQIGLGVLGEPVP